MNIIPIVLLIIGAIAVYGAKPILKKANHRRPTEKEIGIFKSIGLMLVALGSILVFTMK